MYKHNLCLILFKGKNNEEQKANANVKAVFSLMAFKFFSIFQYFFPHKEHSTVLECDKTSPSSWAAPPVRNSGKVRSSQEKAWEPMGALADGASLLL